MSKLTIKQIKERIAYIRERRTGPIRDSLREIARQRGESYQGLLWFMRTYCPELLKSRAKFK